MALKPGVSVEGQQVPLRCGLGGQSQLCPQRYPQIIPFIVFAPKGQVNTRSVGVQEAAVSDTADSEWGCREPLAPPAGGQLGGHPHSPADGRQGRSLKPLRVHSSIEGRALQPPLPSV